MKPNRIERVNSLLKEVISDVINKDVKNPLVSQFITIIKVDVTSDLHHAKVHAGVIGTDAEKKQTIDDIYAMYRKAYDASKETVPLNIRAYFEYRAGSYNPITAITSNFLHGDVWHVGGNLLFFIAFGSVVELVISSYLTYIIMYSEVFDEF